MIYYYCIKIWCWSNDFLREIKLFKLDRHRTRDTLIAPSSPFRLAPVEKTGQAHLCNFVKLAKRKTGELNYIGIENKLNEEFQRQLFNHYFVNNDCIKDGL